jgi:hypothetical protein
MNASCPVHHAVRRDLPPLTGRIAALPVDDRGYPVPFFVSWIDGKPEFRVADSSKFIACVLDQLCWVCGQKLGTFKTFLIGPMCAINRTSAEPPSHRECAEWSVRGCPFLTKPQMVRREDELTRANENNVAGEMIKRNPGVSLVWVTKRFTYFRDHRGGILLKIGEPESVSWWREGRTALRAEILESIESGLPFLLEACQSSRDFEELARRRTAMEALLPL